MKPPATKTNSFPKIQKAMQEIENMCVMFQYATPGNIESIQSELLKHFSVNISTRPELHEQLDKCLQLLHYSKREIVHSIVQNHLRLLLCRKNSLFQSQDLVSLFQTLKQSPPTFTNSKTIFNSYLQILAIITALSWLDSKEIEDSFKKQLEDLENGRDYEIGLVAIYHVISEMNQQTSEIKGFNKHRRVSISFRDEQLLAVLKNGYRIFVEAAEASGSPTETVPGIILEYSVKILMACLNYDFLGYQQDQENHGMTSTIQIPSSWKDFILESFPMNILVKSFQVLPEILHNELLETIGYFLGCKRSLFSESERRTYFDKCLENLMVLLDYPFKNETFSELLKGILRFATVYSPEFKHSSQSSSFLSKFYAYNVSSMGVVTHIDYLCFVLIWVQLRDSEHSFFVDNLEDFQQLVRTLVTIEDQMLECLYTEEVTTLEQIQQPLGKLIRKTLSVSSKLVVERLQRWGMGTTPKDYIETAWTIFLYSGALSHRIAYQASDEDDTNDGIVAGNIFRFIMYKQFQSINEICEETLEIAILSFFEQFKYSFLSSEANSCVRMWESLNNFSVESPEKVLLISLNRILYFLNHSSDENLVCKAADVFHEYVTGVYSCKMLQKTEIMDFIEESGVFQINIQCSYSKSKVIMKVFESIGRYSSLK